ncbi:NAD(P)H-dependent oxidoreductase [Candidatus Saccharibacteria bacterium]|nr:NAD(P)H-dependent oxidoreductase [Candidatus Saccharibacteria bacterium]MCB9817648.1 NAD(P)H-dependent oxidoreductase [Candidatus Nomurabacteria bacterium]HPD99130.1 NAD(P)H-dependent oxidoreductase [Candidatus Saccharibacteria bacterium]
MAHIQVIVGSTRPGRVGRNVADWFMSQAQIPAGSTVEIIDLADINLPMLDEPKSAMMDQYSKDHTKSWSQIISKADGYVWVTPEYNHGTSAVLKNAIDYLYKEWAYKPVAFVGYGGMGATRAIEHLVNIASELRMFPLKSRYHVLDVWAAFNNDGSIKPELVRGDASSLLSEVTKVSDATKSLRQ